MVVLMRTSMLAKMIMCTFSNSSGSVSHLSSPARAHIFTDNIVVAYIVIAYIVMASVASPMFPRLPGPI